MTLRHLKIFVTVCNCGSVTEAGKKLYLAQPSVSLAIRELEEHYSTKLFDRISKHLYITESGKHLLNYANHIVSLTEDMENSVMDWTKKSVLHIGSSITIGNYLLLDYIEKFKQEHDIKIQVKIDNSETIEECILKNEIDVALIEGTVHNDNITQRPFKNDELVFICAPQHPLADRRQLPLEALQKEDFILREPGSAGREAFESLTVLHRLSIEPLWQSVSTQAIVNAVKRNIGISILPYLFVKEDLNAGDLCQFHVKEISLKRQFSLIHHKNKYLSPNIEGFINVCLSDI